MSKKIDILKEKLNLKFTLSAISKLEDVLDTSIVDFFKNVAIAGSTPKLKIVYFLVMAGLKHTKKYDKLEQIEELLDDIGEHETYEKIVEHVLTVLTKDVFKKEVNAEQVGSGKPTESPSQ